MKQEAKKVGEKITRKEALVKTGKYAIFTAASMMTILAPVKTEAQYSPELPPDWY